MSNKAMAWAVDCKVKGSHKLVLMLLAEAHNGHTGACFPSQEWITEKSGLGASTVSNCLQDLETWGLLSRHTKALGRGKGSRRDFELHLEVLDPQILEVLIPGVRPPDSDPLDLQILTPPYKDKPEVNRKEPEPARDRFDEAYALYCSTERKVQQNKKTAKAQWKKAAAKAGGEDRLIQAIQIEVDRRSEPKAFIPNLPDMFRWLRDERWQGVLPAEASLLDTSQPSMSGPEFGSLEYHFAYWAKHKTWRGRADSFLLEPNDPDAKYPSALYAKYGVAMPEGAR